MIRIKIAVIETGSISGKVISQKRFQGGAPSTCAASCSSLGIACNPARIIIIINGMKVHASITMIMPRAISPEPKKEGLSQPRNLASLDIGPKRISSMDLPIIQLTATGESINGIKKATRKNFRARICAFSNTARPKAIAYSGSIASMYQTMFFKAFQ